MEKNDLNIKIEQIANFVLYITNPLVIVLSIIGVLSYLLPSVLLSIGCSMMLTPLFVVNIILFVIRYRRRDWVFTILNAICIFTIGSTILAFSPFASSGCDENRESIDVATYNVYSFHRYKAKGMSVEMVASWAKGQNFDIMALQEYSFFKEDKFFQHFAEQYDIATFTKQSKRGVSNGLAIVSKYPILEKRYFETKESKIFAMYCDLKLTSDTIRVINVHLQSTSVNQNIKGVASSNADANRRLMRLLRDIHKNAEARYIQAESVAQIVNESPYRVVVCGDTNDTPSSYTYKTLRGGLKDSFYEAGLGYAFTYWGYYRTQRIDNIFVSKDINVSDYKTPNLMYSDHKPVVVKIDIL